MDMEVSKSYTTEKLLKSSLDFASNNVDINNSNNRDSTSASKKSIKHKQKVGHMILKINRKFSTMEVAQMTSLKNSLPDSLRLICFDFQNGILQLKYVGSDGVNNEEDFLDSFTQILLEWSFFIGPRSVQIEYPDFFTYKEPTNTV